MMILANDGIHASGKRKLEEAGHTVMTEKVAQDALAAYIKENNVAAVLVRSATKITEKELNSSDSLKAIGRAGVGLDNIDLKKAEELGIAVCNTPAASSQSVAELVLAHLLSVSRSLQLSNREMPEKGREEFGKLKKKYAKGSELRGRTLGIIGLGRIGQTLAELALGLGMKVVGHDPFAKDVEVSLHIHGCGEVKASVPNLPLDELLAQSDAVSLHVPKPKDGALIGASEMKKMKEGAVLINTSRGGVVDEAALLEALSSGHLAAAGLDVFENEPTARAELLTHERISVTPHIGASTGEAQERIGIELAEKILEVLGS